MEGQWEKRIKNVGKEVVELMEYEPGHSYFCYHYQTEIIEHFLWARQHSSKEGTYEEGEKGDQEALGISDAEEHMWAR